MKIKNILIYIFLFLLTALVLDLANPLFDKPSRDGGFFLYAGQQILKGKIPYIEVWDNKGPAIFYINALGLWLGNGSRWGVWIIEFVCIFGMFLIMYSTITKHWGEIPALFGVAMSGLGLRVVLGYGNYTEEYALFFNAIGFYLLFSMLDKEINYWKFFWTGACFGLSFSFRANNIGVFFAMLIVIGLFYILKRNFIEIIKISFYTLIGFFLPLLLWVLYFALLDAVNEMIYGSITFNFSYSAAKDRDKFALIGGFLKGGMGWYGRIAILGWLVFTIRVAYTAIRQKDLAMTNIFLLFWFPIEIMLSNLSGRSFNHYYISWSLAIAVYCTILFSEIYQLLNKKVILQKWDNQILFFGPLILILVLSVFSMKIISRYVDTVSHAFSNPDSMQYIDPISLYIRENTDENDFVLTWYPERGINFISDRTSPVKYTNYPLFIAESLTAEIENTYIDNLISRRPELIIDCSREVDAIPSLDPETKKVQFNTPGLRRKMYIHDGMEIIFDFVKANYHIETKVEDCIIFRLNQ
jgi:hypothetical protein